jgi:hypothetical protein
MTFVVELMGGPMGFPVWAIQPDAIVDLVVGRWQSIIVRVVLISQLGAKHLGAEMVVDASEVLRHGPGTVIIRVVADGGREIDLPSGVAAVHAEEGGGAGGLGGMVVGRELSERQPFDPIVLKVVDMHPKVLLYHRVDPLGLTVSLSMEGGRESSIDSETVSRARPGLRKDQLTRNE